MKCQGLFSGKSKKNIILSSAELAQRVVVVEMTITTNILIFFLPRKYDKVSCSMSS